MLRIIINGCDSFTAKIEGTIKQHFSIKLGAIGIWPSSSFIQNFSCNLDDGLENISIKFAHSMKRRGTERTLADRIRIQSDFDILDKYSEEDTRGNSEEVVQSCTFRPCFHNCEICALLNHLPLPQGLVADTVLRHNL